MKVSAGLILVNKELSHLYYVVRSLDSVGKGWVKSSFSQLNKLGGFSLTSLKRLLKQAVSESWFYEVIWSGQNIFIKYRSRSSLHLLLKPKTFALGVVNKSFLKDKNYLYGRAILIFSLYLQHIAETKLRYLLGRHKLKPGYVLGHSEAASILKTFSNSSLRQRLVKRSSKIPEGCTFFSLSHLKSDSSSRVPLLNPSSRLLPHTAFVKPSTYTVGISQQTIADKLGLSRSTVNHFLKSASKLQTAKPVPLSANFSGEPVYTFADFDEDSSTSICQTYRFMPFTYIDNGVTHKQYRQLVSLSRASSSFSAHEIQVAQLMAPKLGFPYSYLGALKYIASRGLSRFRKFLHKPCPYSQFPLSPTT